MAGLDLVGAIAGLWVDIVCPQCKISNRIRLKEIMIESSMICRGCYKTFHLIEVDASGTRSNRQVKRLEDEINKLSQEILINIKL